ncbi:MAG: insulinase family protein [bacterium]|nr:insulinase family protein [bacterium]
MQIDRTKRPISSGNIDFKLPKIHTQRLDNGLDIYSVEKNELPIIRLNLIVNSGSRYDPLHLQGLNNLLAMCVDEGAGELNSLQLADEFEMLGAQFSVSTDADVILMSLQVLTENFNRALKLFADVLTKPQLNEADFRREQNKVLVKLKQLNAEPDYLADTAFEYFLFSNSSPYAFPTLGIDKTLNKINIETVRNSYFNNFIPLNSKLVVVGDIDSNSLQSQINSAVTEWISKSTMKEQVFEFKNSSSRLFIIDKADSVQTEIRMGHLTTKRNPDDYFQKQIFNLVFGGQFSSRLNLNLREKNGYTYGIHSRFNYWKDAGYFGISTSVDTDLTHPALKEIFYEVDKIIDGITADELEFAKSSMIKRFPSNFETYRQVSGNIISKIMHNLPDDYFESYVDRVNSVTLEEVNKIAKKSIRSDELVTVLAGDSNKILNQLKGDKFGEIKVVEYEKIFEV